jgi:predicted deacylase
MPPASTKRLRRFVVGFWMVNLLVGLLVVAAWFWSRSSAKTTFISQLPTESQTPARSVTLSFTPTETQLPTETRIPTENLPPTQTPPETTTPLPFSEGPITIGKSVKGLPLEVYRYGTGTAERLIVAGMHGGNEYNTVQLAEELMSYLDQHQEILPPDVTLYILHDLNPDGVTRGLSTLGRANANGVDLNRNWPANWQKDWPRSGCWTQTYVTGGTGPASEPETKALMMFIQEHHFDALINYHSAALGIFPGGIPISDASKSLAKALAEVTTYTYPPVNTGCEYTGGMVDWTANQGIASVDLELTNHTDTDFDLNLRVLKAFLNWKR